MNANATSGNAGNGKGSDVAAQGGTPNGVSPVLQFPSVPPNPRQSAADALKTPLTYGDASGMASAAVHGLSPDGCTSEPYCPACVRARVCLMAVDWASRRQAKADAGVEEMQAALLFVPDPQSYPNTRDGMDRFARDFAAWFSGARIKAIEAAVRLS